MKTIIFLGVSLVYSLLFFIVSLVKQQFNWGILTGLLAGLIAAELYRYFRFTRTNSPELDERVRFLMGKSQK
jgi:membrane associated rhomboid family serine protease